MSSDGPQDAPKDWRGTLKHLGPGLIITACIVGSGELIATPKVGAEYGFSLLWFIIVGCMIKVLVQVELGRFAISKGMTTLEALDTVPGPRFIVSWVVWCWLLMFVGILFQLGGIVGSVGKVVMELGWVSELGAHGPSIIAVVVSGGTIAILASGKYKPVEIFSTIMVVFFTFATLFALISLQTSEGMKDFSISWADIKEGLKFQLPGDFSTAFAAFGIIGVGASELIYYPYWCLEKGYAKNVGTANPTTVWYERAKGWLRIMRVDAWLSMVVYTGATVAFFLLGAALLHRAEMPEQKIEKFREAQMPALVSAVDRSPSAELKGHFDKARAAMNASTMFEADMTDAQRLDHVKAQIAVATGHLNKLIAVEIKRDKKSEMIEPIEKAVADLKVAAIGVSNDSMIKDLSQMYRPLGEAGLTIFLVGAFVVLFSTMVTASASNARLLADGLVLFRRIEKPSTEEARAKLLSKCCIAIPVACALMFIFVPKPVTLVLVGGVAQALMLPLLAIAALYFRYKQTDKPLQPGAIWTVFLWISAVAMTSVGLFQLYQKITSG
jgi:Mn2+/Fe2+ NRAMP family transporter